MTTSRAGLALAVAAAVGIGVPLTVIVEQRGRESSAATTVDARLGPLRPHLAPGTRVDLLLPPLDRVEALSGHYLAQYALAPAVVRVVRPADVEGPGPCRPGDGAPLIVAPPDPERVRRVAARCGLETLATAPGAVLLGRRP